MRRFLSLCLLLSSACATLPLAARKGPDTWAPPSRPGVEVTVVPLRLGTARSPRCVAAGDATCWIWTDLVHASYVVKHPRGTFLVDAGISAHAQDDVNHFSFWDRFIFGLHDERGLRQALTQAGVESPDFVLLTHAHWDHTSGLVELDHPHVFMGPGEDAFVQAHAASPTPLIRPDHLAGVRRDTFVWDGPAYENFERSHDWFGDGSIVLVPLPGHTPGSLGVFVNQVKGKRLFFVGDAAWSMEAIELPSHKLKALSRRVDDDPEQLSDTLWRLHTLHAAKPEIVFVPAHDLGALQRVQALVATP